MASMAHESREISTHGYRTIAQSRGILDADIPIWRPTKPMDMVRAMPLDRSYTKRVTFSVMAPWLWWRMCGCAAVRRGGGGEAEECGWSERRSDSWLMRETSSKRDAWAKSDRVTANCCADTLAEDGITHHALLTPHSLIQLHWSEQAMPSDTAPAGGATETLSLTDELRQKTRGLHVKTDRLVQLGLFTVLDYQVSSPPQSSERECQEAILQS